MNRYKYIMIGGMVYSSIMSLWQDFRFASGAAYAEWVKNNWIDRSISIPLAVVFLAIAMGILWMDEDNDKRN